MRSSITLLLLGALALPVQFSFADEAAKKDEPAKKSDRELASEVQRKLRGNPAAAEDALKQLIDQNPDYFQIASFRSQIAYTYYRTRRNKDAVRVYNELLDSLIEGAKANRPNGLTGVAYAGTAVSMLSRLGQKASAFEKLDTVLELVQAARAKKDLPVLASQYSNLVSTKATALAQDKPDAAMELIAKDVEEATKAYEADKTNIHNRSRVANSRFSQLRVAYAAVSKEEFAKMVDEHLAFIKKFAEEKLDITSVNAVTNGHLFAVSVLTSTDVEHAEKLLKDLKAYHKQIETEDPDIKRFLGQFTRAFASYERRISVAKKHQQLIGQDAIKLDAAAFVNGDAVTDEDLKGKVVLIDFWAVWCGPCIATFPHLIEWQEKYADKGLVILGVTRYYKYDWDDTAKRIKRDPQLTPEAEQAAVQAFAKHHKLKHRLLFVPQRSTYQADYGVSGIPQAVVVDRKGKVRMIKVGSGEQNAHDIEELIEKLIAE